MSEIEMIERRLQRFAEARDDSDWQDVLHRAGCSTTRSATRWRRPRLTRRRLVAAVIVVVALALPALAISGALGSLFRISARGTPAHPGLYTLHELHGHAKLFAQAGHPIPVTAQANPRTFVRLAFRDGIGVYGARTKRGNHRCFYYGRRKSFRGHPRNALYLEGPGCFALSGNFGEPQRFVNGSGAKNMRQSAAWVKAHPFPSPSSPVLDMSGLTRLPSGQLFIESLVGVAADGVRSIQLLALSDCRPVVTVPVVNDVYIDAHPPKVAETFMVARDHNGKVIWHSSRLDQNPFRRTPLDRKVTRNCGLASGRNPGP
jgi:hypothetical protein